MAALATWKLVFYSSVFLSCVSFAVVMPTLWPYLESLGSSKGFLAWVVAIYSIGEALGAVFFGMLSTFLPTRLVMICTTACGLVGALLYCASEAFPQDYKGAKMVLVGRFLQGLWTGGAQSVQQVHLSKVLPVDELTPVTVALNASACLGFVFGPAVGLLAGLLPSFTIPCFPALHFSEITAAGYAVLLDTVVIILLFAFVFGEGGLSTVTAPSDTPVSPEQHPLLHMQPSRIPSARQRWVLSAVVCNVAFFTHFYGFALQETVTTPLVQTYFGWSVLTANVLFTVAGGVSLLAFGAVGALSGRVSDLNMAGASLLIGTVGFACLVALPGAPLGEAQFLGGFLVISLAFPIGRASIIALYTKVLPAEWQGAGQGIILAVGAVARIIGPFWAVRAFFMRWGDVVVFGGTAGLFMLTLGLLYSVCYGGLVPDISLVPLSAVEYAGAKPELSGVYGTGSSVLHCNGKLSLSAMTEEDAAPAPPA